MTIAEQDDFRLVRNRVEQICEQYRVAEIKLRNINNSILNNKINEKQINQYRNYVRTFELILRCLNKEEANLIRDINLNRIPSDKLGYSRSIYYVKYRKAATSFLRYLS
ncbi:MAG: hypothetical protein LBF36_00335 [Mycoplasmataceae bacterium]|jgi:hypothetical protein|nr:hypothetical protein [Mycoplasmataceae bacterium]